MKVALTQRVQFTKDVEEASEQLCFNLAHLDKEGSIENMMAILTALRIAAMTFEEYTLQKNVEGALAMMINHHQIHDKKMINMFYEIAETMVYPYKKNTYIAR